MQKKENKLTYFWLKSGVKPDLETSRVLMETKTAETSFSNWIKIKLLNTLQLRSQEESKLYTTVMQEFKLKLGGSSSMNTIPTD